PRADHQQDGARRGDPRQARHRPDPLRRRRRRLLAAAPQHAPAPHRRIGVEAVIVTCPRCATRYRAPAAGPPEGASYRCTRSPTVSHPDEPTPGTPDEGEPEFVFEALPPPQPAREPAPEASPRRSRKEAPEAAAIDGADPAR